MKVKRRTPVLKSAQGYGKDRGGFGYALNRESDSSSAVAAPTSIFDLQRHTISIMQEAVRIYMGGQRERLEAAASATQSTKTLVTAYMAKYAATTTTATAQTVSTGKQRRQERRRQREERSNVAEVEPDEVVLVGDDPATGVDEQKDGQGCGDDSNAQQSPPDVSAPDSGPVGQAPPPAAQVNMMEVNLLDISYSELVNVVERVTTTTSTTTMTTLTATATHTSAVAQPSGGLLLDLSEPAGQEPFPKVETELDRILVGKEAATPIVEEPVDEADPTPIVDSRIPPPSKKFVADEGTTEDAPLECDDTSASSIADVEDNASSDNVNYDDIDEDEPEVDMSWMILPEVPSSAEILPKRADSDHWVLPTTQDDSPPVAVNRINGAWPSKHEYLRSHYLMMREDAIKPLRDSVEIIRSNPYTRETDNVQNSIGIYDKVRVTAVTYATTGISVKVVFSLNRVEKKIHWEQSKRLVTGSLVALTPADDLFKKECIIATVAGRSLKGLNENPPELDLYFARDSEIQLDPSIEFLMVEDRGGFYEAQRHTLLALQNMVTEPFPLSEYLVELESKLKAPPYVADHPVMNFSPICDSAPNATRFNSLEPWPEFETSLDQTQTSALRRMLTKDLAIIQGPPGTGKTHVSIKAIEIMLKSMPADAPPIIVTCQTNHALDQLLRHIAKFEPNFIRLGARSKDLDVVKKRTLFPVRAEMEPPKFLSSSLYRANNGLRACTEKLMSILEPLSDDSSTSIDAEAFVKYGILTAEQVASLETSNSEWVNFKNSQVNSDSPENLISTWLGKALINSDKSFEREDLAYEFEEQDPEFEVIGEQEAEDVLHEDNDDFEVLNGIVTSIHVRHSAKEKVRLKDSDCEKILQGTNLYRIEPKFRPSVFMYIQRKLKEKVIRDFRSKAREYNRLAHVRRTATFERDVAILRQQRVIGLTTTGFSKYRAMIVALRPQVVMIEEAAESLEAPVIAACVPSLQQLILVGDHKQLRPHTQVQKHEGDPVNLNVSLFERMILNDFKFSVLRRQRRMRPEIRRILRPIYDNALLDHPSLKEPDSRPPIPGMGGLHSYFYTHAYPEGQDSHKSSVNDWEAHMVMGLVEYLVLNGTEQEKITVITFYNGQRKKILSLLRGNRNISSRDPEKQVNVSTVDSYQGEENDVVILSLVRSNDRGRIGFLEVENRVCVALSRARNGFYIFGNALLVCCENPTWESVVQIMAGKAGEDPPDLPKRRLGFHLPLVCKNHGRRTFIEEPDDWEKLSGGCEIKCDGVLPCGHKCMLRCHPFPHEETACLSPCNKALECGHACSEQCGAPCVCSSCAGYEGFGESAEEEDDDDDDDDDRSGRRGGGGGGGGRGIGRAGRGRTHEERMAKGQQDYALIVDDPSDAEPWGGGGDDGPSSPPEWNRDGGGAVGGGFVPDTMNDWVAETVEPDQDLLSAAGPGDDGGGGGDAGEQGQRRRKGKLITKLSLLDI